MTYVNLFPAILLAGPPNTGKSVFAYHCSIQLKKHKTPFILLRTTPDGEGDWFLEAEKLVGVALRQENKRRFTPQLIDGAVTAIQRRTLPMLVDVGGRPRGEQFRILQACTHSILLYRTDDERAQWQKWLNDAGLIPIAELRSQNTGQDQITGAAGPLQGVISGLDRFNPRLGATFEKTMTRIRGIFDYPPTMIQERHLRAAPQEATVVIVNDLARVLGVSQDERGYWWAPRQIPQALDLLPAETPIALYGRGPAWLYAAIAAHTAPAPFYLFDARHFGWMSPPTVILDSDIQTNDIQFIPIVTENALRLKIKLQPRFLIPGPLHLPPLPATPAIILDGKAPLWLFSALARTLRPFYAQIYLYDPRLKKTVLAWNNADRTEKKTLSEISQRVR